MCGSGRRPALPFKELSAIVLHPEAAPGGAIPILACGITSPLAGLSPRAGAGSVATVIPSACDHWPMQGARLDRTFRISVALKGLDGLLEVVGGFALVLVPPRSINHVVRTLMAHELAQDPHDFIARHLLHSASQLSGRTTLYGAVYLLSHGVAKVVLVGLVLRNKLWAYPWMVALILVFIAYQLYQITYRPSFALIALSVFDAFVVWLTLREYRSKRRALQTGASA